MKTPLSFDKFFSKDIEFLVLKKREKLKLKAILLEILTTKTCQTDAYA